MSVFQIQHSQKHFVAKDKEGELYSGWITEKTIDGFMVSIMEKTQQILETACKAQQNQVLNRGNH